MVIIIITTPTLMMASKQADIMSYFTQATTTTSDFQESAEPEASRQVEESDEADSETEFSDNEDNEEAANDLPNGTWPSCWDKKMWQSKKKEYPWLVYNDEKLGCSFCKKVSNLGCHSSKSTHLSKEWQSTLVSASGTTKEKQLTSLRNKIKRHKDSVGHSQADRILKTASKETMENSVVRANEKQFASTRKLFRIAYKIGKLGRPFSDMPVECDVSILNGVDIGCTLQSDKSCRAIIDHIGCEMRFKVCKMAIDSDTKMSIIIDESTTISKKSALIVYIKVCLPEPTTLFLDIIELDNQGAECIFTTLMECLDMYGFTLHVLAEKLICFASDGASVMLGSRSGVATRILEVFPNVIIWHCMNHRLELAVNDVINEVSGTNHFKAFFDKLYCLYHTSSKNRRELEELCNSLTCVFHTVGRVLDTRWVASSFRTVKSVWDLYTPLHTHLVKASEDPTRGNTERATFKGMATRMATDNFILNLGAMYDSLEELASLSKDLQERNLVITRAHNLVQRQIRVFLSMIKYPGTHYKEAKAAVEGKDKETDCKFKGVVVTDSRKSDVQIRYEQFMRSLATNLERRLMSSNHNTEKLLKAINVLDPSQWPDDCPLMYGQEDVAFLCDLFHLNGSETTIKRSLCEYIDIIRERGFTCTTPVPEALSPLQNAVNTIVISSADCERGFSQMNVLATPVRSSLTIQTLSSLMFVKIVGPPPRHFDPSVYVQKWIMKKHSLSDDSKARKRKHNNDEEHEYFGLWQKLKTE